MKEQYKSASQLIAETAVMVEALRRVSDICDTHENSNVRKVIDMEQILKEAQHVDCICVDGVILTREEVTKMVAG